MQPRPLGNWEVSPLRRSARLLRFAIFAVAPCSLCACGGSENSGGAAETAEDLTADAQAGASVAARSPVWDEYRALVRSLGPLRVRAFADPEIERSWDQLAAQVDERLAAEDEFYRDLLEQERQIEARFAETAEGGNPPTDEERAELISLYESIQNRLGGERNRLFRQTELGAELQAFQGKVYQRMRELNPARVADIDRLEELTLELYQGLESVEGARGLAE